MIRQRPGGVVVVRVELQLAERARLISLTHLVLKVGQNAHRCGLAAETAVRTFEAATN